MQPISRGIVRARYAFDWKKQFAFSLDPETAQAMHDETLPEKGFKDAAAVLAQTKV
jgi:thiamine biosynthesis protein ThiC